jgi:hypothetical protein
MTGIKISPHAALILSIISLILSSSSGHMSGQWVNPK